MRVVYREDQQQREHEGLSEEAAFADGTEGRMASWASCAAGALLVFQARL